MTATLSACFDFTTERSAATCRPMLAVLAPVIPADQQNYAFEFKWDGMRALAFWDGRNLRLRTRNGLDTTTQYPELTALGEALGNRPCVLDGEICVLDETDRPSFPLLQKRMKVTNRLIAERLSRELPVHFFVFDLLYLGRKWITDQPWTKRRAMLGELTVKGPHWEISRAVIGEGKAVLKTAEQFMLEGIVAKRLDSRYFLGQRNPAWLKIKLVQRQEFVVGGWTPEKDSSTRGGLGALQIGYYDCNKPQRLHYAGGVGSGFTAETHRQMLKLLEARRTGKNPFVEKLPKRNVTFVKPDLVVEVEYRRWPAGGMVQQTAFKGVRTDKPAREVVREDRACA